MASEPNLAGIVDRFSSVEVLVVGDVILDRYLRGEASRISPEAPVPVVQLRQVVHRPGGAANVAANLVSLGGSAGLVGCVGSDSEAETLMDLLNRQGVAGTEVVVDEHRPTTCKTRVIAERQQVVRVDWENRAAVSAEVESRLVASIEVGMRGADVIVVSDYGKGVVTDTLCRDLISLARREGRPVVVDPKGRDYGKYHGATIIVPNQQEAGVAAGTEIDDDRSAMEAGRALLRSAGCEAVLITRGGEGVSVIMDDGNAVNLPTLARQVFDVTGAGDTMVAALSLAIAARASLVDAAAIANAAAGLVVEKVGTAVVRREELVAALGRADAWQGG